MEIGLIRRIDIDQEVKLAYMDYAMSVIVARALPDSRDGLKPVHRRILFAMRDMGIGPDASHKKSARIVGEVLGKYHPHGDMAVYDAMARMAQEFSMRYPLIDGQGNFGSIDGDSPAAMRYTEARLANPAIYMLDDIEKETVDFEENFDGSLKEPTVLPAAIPNLLVNGASGIAVGMATSIPPHNLAEIIDALQYVLKNWKKVDEISIEELLQYVQGPDFPTGGVVIQDESGDSLVSAYSTGKGKLTIRASAHIEEMVRGRSRIIVSELPYMTNKSSLIERIAELVRETKLEGISDLRDESDRHGLRIVIELNKNANPEVVLENLYKLTPMQNTLSIIMLALVNGEPRLLSLKQALRVYLEHRLEIVRRRSVYELSKARSRAHILEGIRIALENLDEVIDIIRRSPDVNNARTRLQRRFKLSEIQAQAILDFPLRRLAALERKRIEVEYKELLKQIGSLEALLKTPQKMRNLVNDELQMIKEKFSDKRRTRIAHLSKQNSKRTVLTTSDLTPEKITWISITTQGLISRTSGINPPRLSGKNAPAWLIRANSRDILYILAERGVAVALPVHSLPESDDPGEGVPYHKISALTETDKIAGIFSLPSRKDQFELEVDIEHYFIITVTKNGMLKKSALSELPGATAEPFTIMRINPTDSLVDLRISDGKNEILLVSKYGMAIRFYENEVRPMGLVAAGVSGIKLKQTDLVIGMELLPQSGEIFMVNSDGFAKRVAPDQFPVQGRYGQGVIAWNLGQNSQIVGVTIGKGSKKAVLFMLRLLPKSIRLDDAPIQNRSSKGKLIQPLKGNDRVIRLVTPWEVLHPGFNLSKLRKSKSPGN